MSRISVSRLLSLFFSNIQGTFLPQAFAPAVWNILAPDIYMAYSSLIWVKCLSKLCRELMPSYTHPWALSVFLSSIKGRQGLPLHRQDSMKYESPRSCQLDTNFLYYFKLYIHEKKIELKLGFLFKFLLLY